MSIWVWTEKPPEEAVRYTQEERKIFAATYKIAGTVTAFGLAGILTICLFAWGMRGGLSFYAFVGVDFLVAGAAAAAGALFGFVFGIPRTLEPASRAAVVTAAKLEDPAASQAATMGVNTNLERISDWLTTLLIGATLVQIKEIAGWVSKLGSGLLATGEKANDAIVPIIVIYFFALSFLGVYLITRLYLTSALRLLGMFGATTLDLAVLKKQLKAVAGSGTADEQQAAISRFEDWNFKFGEADDAELNANVARILAKRMQAGAGKDRVALLKATLAKAVADPTTKAQLKIEFDAGDLTAADATIDAAISAAVS